MTASFTRFDDRPTIPYTYLLHISFHQRMGERCHETCVDQVAGILDKSSSLHYLVDQIQELGCPVPPGWIQCSPCDQLGDFRMSGGFAIDPETRSPTIMICENERLNHQTLEDTLLHELIHAYDVCRAKIDFSQCFQHACTEVRASALSGECNFSREFRRGNLQIQKGYQKCVKRRAIKSVGANPYCRNIAKEAVESVFEKCFSDTLPFEDHCQSQKKPLLSTENSWETLSSLLASPVK